MQLILASQSPYRRAQLEQFGVNFEAIKPNVDEDELKAKGPTDLFELTRFLAHCKAESLRDRFAGAILLGSDQVAEIDARRLDKPGTRAKAIEQLESLQGRAHRLITSLTVSAPELVQTYTDVTTITLRALSRSEIETYVDHDQPLDCAGAYKIERAGMTLVASIESMDFSAIQGLPLLSLSVALNKLKYDWASAWRIKGATT